MTSGFSPKLQPAKSEPNNRFAIAFVAVVAVVILGIAVLYFFPPQRKVRKSSRQTAIVADGRILGNAAQQYFLMSGKTQVSFSYNPATGELTGDLTPWIKTIGKGYSIPDTTIESGASQAFTIQQPPYFKGQAVTFSDEGKTTFDPNTPY